MKNLIKIIVSSIATFSLLAASQSPAFALDPSRYPHALDKCETGSPYTVGYSASIKKYIVMSCGPDNRWHKQIGQPDVDQKTGKILAPKPKTAPKVPAGITNDDGTGNIKYIQSALNQVVSRVATGPKIQLLTDFDPKIPKAIRDAAMLSARSFINAFGDQFPGKTKLYLVFSASPANIKKQYQAIGAKEGIPNLVELQAQGLEFNTRKDNPKQFIGASGITGPLDGDSSMVSVFYGDAGTFDRDRYFIVPGEMKHAMFYANAPIGQLAPCFMTPANAGLFGMAFSYPGESTESLFYTFIRNGANFTQLEGKKLFNSLDLSSLEDNPPAQISGAECGVAGDFILSGVAGTLLVGKYGLEKQLDYLRAFGQDRSNWRKLFEETYGFSINDFYAEAKDYLTWYKKWFYKTIKKKPVPAK